MDESLYRFAFESSKVKKTKQEVVPKLFDPKADKNGKLELSVERINNSSSREQIIEAGLKVGKKRKNAENLHGWAKFTEEVLNNIVAEELNVEKLEIEHDSEPCRHSTIKNWPTDKEDVLTLKAELARYCNMAKFIRNCDSVALPNKVPI